MRHATSFALLALVASACAREPARVSVFRFSLPAELTNCTNKAAFDGLLAELYIEGNFPVCALTVDADTLAVSGRCPDITVSQTVALAIHYHLVRNTIDLSLAFAVTSVDLSPGAVPPVDDPNEQPEVPATFDSNSLLYKPADIDAISIPNNDCNDPAVASDPKMWVKCEVINRNAFALGCGTNPSVPNLNHVCAQNFADCL